MNQRRNVSILIGCLIAVAFALRTAPDAQAQNPPTNLGNSDTNNAAGKSAAALDLAKAHSDAKALAKSNNVAAAEAKLTPLNANKLNTAPWHVETAQRLMQLAGDIAHEGDSAHVNAVVNQALQHLDQLQGPSAGALDARDQAQAKALAGFIYERFQGDLASAIESYQAALRYTPNDKALQEHLDRLQRADAFFKKRVQSSKS